MKHQGVQLLKFENGHCTICFILLFQVNYAGIYEYAYKIASYCMYVSLMHYDGSLLICTQIFKSFQISTFAQISIGRNTCI